jgi:hypothetical protein
MAHTLASSSDIHLSAPSDVLHPSVGIDGDRRLIQEAQWQEEALQSSATVDSQGTPLPIVWASGCSSKLHTPIADKYESLGLRVLFLMEQCHATKTPQDHYTLLVV